MRRHGRRGLPAARQRDAQIHASPAAPALPDRRRSDGREPILLGNLGTIAGGVFEGHIDASRITWIGHSRGGEGVARAYDRLFDGAFVPDHYSIDDIRLVSSIAPNDYLGRLRSNPHGVAYHLLIGAADGDNGGWPNRESDAPFHVFERAEGYRQATNVHGADHNDFNCCGINDFRGPPGTAIGRAEAQRVAKAMYLALIKHYIDGSRAARDFLWRQYEVLRPLGIDADTIVDREYVEAPHAGLFVIDDFQSEPSLGTSSSGGAVTGDVRSRFEGQHDDTDGTFTWSAGDPMNGTQPHRARQRLAEMDQIDVRPHRHRVGVDGGAAVGKHPAEPEAVGVQLRGQHLARLVGLFDQAMGRVAEKPAERDRRADIGGVAAHGKSRHSGEGCFGSGRC